MKFDRCTYRRSLASVLAATLLLVSCGEGGGGDGLPLPTPAPTIALVAGSLQAPGSRDGPGATAQFNGPRGVVQDSAGNAYVADTGNHTIRKIAPDGTVTTLSGAAGQAGSTDGPASTARFSGPNGLAIDTGGNLFVADSGNSTIRKISAAGVVTTVAGTAGQAGTVDGSATLARFQSLADIAVDPSGNLYVVAAWALRKVATDGNVSTFATMRSSPITAVATDADGNVYVSESPISVSLGSGTGTIRRYSGAGAVLPWGAAVDGSVVATFPVGLAVDATGNVYVASSGVQAFSPGHGITTREILKISPAGEVSSVSGAVNGSRTSDGPAASARFRDPHGISVGAGGRLVITEFESSAVRQIDAQGVVSTLAGGVGDGFIDGPGGSARFFTPNGLAAGADGTLYVVDTGNQSVRKISPAGVVSTLPLTGYACRYEYAAVDPAGTLFLEGAATSFVRTVCAVDPSGASRFYADSSFRGGGVAVDSAGRVLLGGASIERINADGSRQVLASGFNQVGGIVANPAGVIYVADSANQTVHAIAEDGSVTLLAGQSGKAGLADGTGSDAKLYYPGALTLDDHGNLYVADTLTIRRITPQGEVRTIAGVPGQSGVQPGPALAPLGRVRGLAWYSGALYATVQNAVIRIAPLD